MAFMLTTGCLLGALAVYGVARRANYLSTEWAPYIQAHANSQLYGWVGLFIMGFSLRQHAPSSERAGLFRGLAAWSLGLIAVSIPLRFAAEAMIGVEREPWLTVGMISGALQVAAVTLFVINIATTRNRAKDPETGSDARLPWQGKFVFAALGWWILVVLAEPVVFLLAHREDPHATVLFVARWFVPYRDAQFLGFVTNMIFGVALARLGTDFGMPAPYRKIGNTAFVYWNLGLAARMAGWIYYFNSGMERDAGWLYHLGGIAMAVGALFVVISSRLYERPAEAMPAHKFILAAFTWLLAGGALIILEPVHLLAIGAPFSHAYTGAIRHAITVGFISQMILGVSSHIVPRLRGAAAIGGGALWAIFILLNAGNALRVGCEVATDYTHQAFAFMGMSGFIELTGLVIWAMALARVMFAPTEPSGARKAVPLSPTNIKEFV
jgi:hypothetical protein